MRRASIAALAMAASLVAAGCGASSSQHADDAGGHKRTTTTTTTTTTLPPTTATTRPPAAGLRPGPSGPAVSMLQQRLIALHYDIPSADGNYGDATRQAVIALQKVNGLDRDGVAGPQTLAKLQTASTPPPLVPGGGSTRVEVDVSRQVLFFYEGGSLYKIVAVSTGFGGHFCDNGDCSVAVTPAGSFHVNGKVDGWQTGRLGRMYKPSYFDGNIAIHGAESIPSYPASHGCVRVPMSSADWIYSALSYGTPVYVINGPNVPAPFAGQAPSLTPDADQRPGDVTPGVAPPSVPPAPSTVPTTRPSAPTTRPPVTSPPTTKPPVTTTKP